MTDRAFDRNSGVLLVHGRYRAYGGEDATVEAEAALLRTRGHEVRRVVLDADVPDGIVGKVALAARAAWSTSGRVAIEREIAGSRPAVLHAHNTFPQPSPSIYRAARRAGVAVVQSLHNYRLVCPAQTLFRDGRPCRDCVGRAIAWPGVLHACRGDRAETAAVAAVIGGHRMAGTWRRDVDLYLAPSPFLRDVLIDGGLDAGQIVVVPPVVDVLVGPDERRHAAKPYALFAGRLVREKGTEALALAAARLAGLVDVVVVGDGPERAPLERAGATVLGHRPRVEVQRLMSAAEVVVMPSVWDEPFGMVAAEAMGCGVPVIATRVGGLESLVDHGVTGWLVDRGDARALVDRLRWCAEHPAEVTAAGDAARAVFARDHAPDVSYARLVDAFALAVDRSRAISD
ncbi:MAG: glycosyl transferase group 1 [Acidimicrobiales bacterium]|nr:glycosyl transferase group 1 [Acidimicrobiales bacterium]